MGALELKTDTNYDKYLEDKKKILLESGESPQSVDEYIERIKKIHGEMEIKG